MREAIKDRGRLEHILSAYSPSRPKVAPLVGAWIETVREHVGISDMLSHPSWVYGLKQSLHNGVNLVSQSHPKQTNTSAKNVEVFCYITESFLSSQ